MLAERSGSASCKVHGRPWASGVLAFALAFCAAPARATGLAGFGAGRVAAPWVDFAVRTEGSDCCADAGASSAATSVVAPIAASARCHVTRTTAVIGLPIL